MIISISQFPIFLLVLLSKVVVSVLLYESELIAIELFAFVIDNSKLTFNTLAIFPSSRVTPVVGICVSRFFVCERAV